MLPVVTDQLAEAVAAFARVPPFDAYVDPAALLVVAARGRRGPHGRRAACHFTRFRDSRSRVSRDGRFELPEIVIDGREIRYVVSFVLPRFLFLEQREQAEDIVHELLHVDRSFDGAGSPLRHGPRYDRLTRIIARDAALRGVHVPPLPGAGAHVLYRRLRPFPAPFRRHGRDAGHARRRFDETDLELTALTVDPADRAAPPPRFVYECPVCGRLYPRQRTLGVASCAACAPRYDARFRLRRLAE